tara:strand:+ start:873 stop:3242 length:2370 start_codon:yes stop_codon:yes gene_type:complete
MATSDEINKQNEMLDAQLNTVEALSRLAQQRVVFEGEVADEISNENDILRDLSKELSKIEQGTLKRVNQQRELNKASGQNLNIARSLQSITASELGTQKLLDKIAIDRVKLTKNINFLQKQAQQTFSSDVKLNRAIQDSILAQVDAAKKLNNELSEVENISKSIANDGFLKIFNNVKDIVNLIPGLNKLLPGFDKAAQGYREALTTGGGNLKEIQKRNAILSGKTGGKGLDQDFISKLPEDMRSKLVSKSGEQLTGTAAVAKAKKLGLQLTTPLKAAFSALKTFMKKFILLQLVASILKVDKVVGDLAKSFNGTYQESLQIQSTFQGIASSSENVFVTGTKIAETQMAINKELGTSVMLTDEQLITMTKLREAAGFTNEELAGIAKISFATGKEMETITGEVLAQAKISSLRNGVVLNEREVLKDISKVSAATTLSLGKNPKAIAEAVATAKSLGMELSKIDAIAGSILNFESSIEDELSAELLLGKELNLDKARQAALNNDLATVAEEIAEQAGTAAEFGKMGRIQQEALAKAVGMNREELAQTLFVQEQLSGVSGKEAENREKVLNARIAEVGLAQATQEIADGQLENLENQASVQDRINATMEKLSEVFATIAPLVLSIADILIDILEPVVTVLSPLFQGIAYAVGLISEGLNVIKPVLKIIGVLVGIIAVGYAAIATAAALASAFTNPIKFAVGAGLALAGIGIVSQGIKASKADDLMSSPTGGSGYGDRILVGKEGAYAFNNRDTIQASTQGSPTQQSTSVVETKLYIDNEAFAQASSKSFSKL